MFVRSRGFCRDYVLNPVNIQVQQTDYSPSGGPVPGLNDEYDFNIALRDKIMSDGNDNADPLLFPNVTFM